MSRFGKETLDILNLDVATAVETFNMGFKKIFSLLRGSWHETFKL